MAEELTPRKEEGNDKDSNRTGGEGTRGRRRSSSSADEAKDDAFAREGVREDVLRELAKACKRQGNFHLACKKYTQVWSWLR